MEKVSESNVYMYVCIYDYVCIYVYIYTERRNIVFCKICFFLICISLGDSVNEKKLFSFKFVFSRWKSGLDQMLNLFWFFLFLFKHLKKLDPTGPDIVACEDPTEKELEANDETDEQAHRPSQQFGHVHLMMNGRNCKVISVKISSLVDFHLVCSCSIEMVNLVIISMKIRKHAR